ncbi:Hsp20/alpha crystallin family protein [Actinocorallia populi]|uniref:Hsp20/alpha crystallin family protein n=1 Tax=Actinocorallia populi TaxID=2079200 RepID=UPI001E5C93FC|nr:Hsp20/alpha crystallin family protein [Actinocorallia populi]
MSELLDLPFGDWQSLLSPLAEQTQAIRVEDYVDDSTYVVRAELPGIDPDRDVEITVSDDDVLRIHAERRQEQREGKRSEFRYGAFTRSLALPHGVEAEDVQASYDQGVLTVRMPLPQDKPEARRITVKKTAEMPSGESKKEGETSRK